MKIKLEAKNFEKLKDKVKKQFKSIVESRKFLNEIGKEIVFDIQGNARTGNIINANGEVKKMDPLAPSTLVHRDYLERAGNAKAIPYRNKLSNLSMSGQLINSIKYTISGPSLSISATGIRRNYLKLDGKRSRPKRTPTNEELLLIHQNGNLKGNLPARPILGLRNQMKQRIYVKVKEYFRRK